MMYRFFNLRYIVFSFFIFIYVFLKASEHSPSPTCLSDRPPGCSDARVFRNMLNYIYQGTLLNGENRVIQIDSVDSWYDETKSLLIQIMKEQKINIGDKNMALSSVQIIYEEEKELKVSEIHNLPYIYCSGSESDLIPTDENYTSRIPKPNALGEHPEYYTIKTMSDFISTEGPYSTPAGNVAFYLQKLLLDYFNTEFTPTKFNTDVINKMHTSIQSNHLSYIQQYYFHSEQALLIHLQKNPEEILNTILGNLPAGAVIHQIALYIVSDRQMCRTCSRTCFRSAESAGHVVENLRTFIKNYPEKNFQTAQDQINLFIECSGLQAFECPSSAYRKRHSGQLDRTIQSDLFVPHVAHENIGKTGDEINK